MHIVDWCTTMMRYNNLYTFTHETVWARPRGRSSVLKAANIFQDSLLYDGENRSSSKKVQSRLTRLNAM